MPPKLARMLPALSLHRSYRRIYKETLFTYAETAISITSNTSIDEKYGFNNSAIFVYIIKSENAFGHLKVRTGKNYGRLCQSQYLMNPVQITQRLYRAAMNAVPL